MSLYDSAGQFTSNNPLPHHLHSIKPSGLANKFGSREFITNPAESHLNPSCDLCIGTVYCYFAAVQSHLTKTHFLNK